MVTICYRLPASCPSETTVCELVESCSQKPSCLSHTEVQHGTQHAEQHAREKGAEARESAWGPRIHMEK